MAVRTRRVWRAAPATLVVVTLFAVASGLGIPVLAYLIYLRQESALVPGFLVLLAVAGLVYAWRFGFHPRIQADADGVLVVNPRRRAAFAWDDITVLASGADGLIVGSESDRLEAWCVQKSNWSTRHGRHTRSDDIVEELADLQDRYDPPLEDEETGLRIRRARSEEYGLLTRLERASSEAALGHIFPPKEYPYPVADVQRRWRGLLRHRRVQVRVLELVDTPVGFIAYESAGTIRHLGIAPHHARRGFGSLLLEYACQEIFDGATPEAQLWVLADNAGARRFYARHGWTETGETQKSEYRPFPEEIRLVKLNPAAPRRRR